MHAGTSSQVQVTSGVHNDHQQASNTATYSGQQHEHSACSHGTMIKLCSHAHSRSLTTLVIPLHTSLRHTVHILGESLAARLRPALLRGPETGRAVPFQDLLPLPLVPGGVAHGGSGQGSLPVGCHPSRAVAGAPRRVQVGDRQPSISRCLLAAAGFFMRSEPEGDKLRCSDTCLHMIKQRTVLCTLVLRAYLDPHAVNCSLTSTPVSEAADLTDKSSTLRQCVAHCHSSHCHASRSAAAAGNCFALTDQMSVRGKDTSSATTSTTGRSVHWQPLEKARSGVFLQENGSCSCHSSVIWLDCVLLVLPAVLRSMP